MLVDLAERYRSELEKQAGPLLQLRSREIRACKASAVSTSVICYSVSDNCSRLLRASSRMIASNARPAALYRPCFQAFWLPFGAPVALPPCIQHRPFDIAGDRHGLPLRARQPHRRLKCIANLFCMGLFAVFLPLPYIHVANNRPPMTERILAILQYRPTP